MTKRFPRAPQLGPRPFEDPNGPNPFADEPGKAIPYPDSVFASSAAGEIQPYRPGDFVPALPNRSARVLGLGMVAMFFSATSLLILLLALSSGGLSSLLVYSWPTGLLAFSFSIPAWIMGGADLRAIRAGAMAPEGFRRTRIGYWCGCIATLTGAIPWVLSVISIVLGSW